MTHVKFLKPQNVGSMTLKKLYRYIWAHVQDGLSLWASYGFEHGKSEQSSAVTGFVLL